MKSREVEKRNLKHTFHSHHGRQVVMLGKHLILSLGLTCPTQFTPAEGSYQANPPFVPCIIDRMAEHILQLLHAAHIAGKALSFTVFLPGWLESEVNEWLDLGSLGRVRGKRVAWFGQFV